MYNAQCMHMYVQIYVLVCIYKYYFIHQTKLQSIHTYVVVQFVRYFTYTCKYIILLCIQIHTNGYISLEKTGSGSGSGFGSGSGSGSGSGFGSTSGLVSKTEIVTLFWNIEPLIGLFLSDVDTTGVGNVSYRLSNTASEYTSLEQTVQSYFNRSFIPSHLLIATWSDVGYYSGQTDQVGKLSLACNNYSTAEHA